MKKKKGKGKQHPQSCLIAPIQLRRPSLPLFVSLATLALPRHLFTPSKVSHKTGSRTAISQQMSGRVKVFLFATSRPPLLKPVGLHLPIIAFPCQCLICIISHHSSKVAIKDRQKFIFSSLILRPNFVKYS